MNNKLFYYFITIIFLVSVILVVNNYTSDEEYDISLIFVDIKNVQMVKVKTKKEIKKSNTNLGQLKEVSFEPLREIEEEKEEEPVVIIPENPWHLPTEVGIVSQYPSYYHVAYDITSPRGVGEAIYPVANGVISGIYRDPAGALTVTILHYIDNQYYTSQYVHLSRYGNISVGQNVTYNDIIGYMGSTGYSTGVHLHLAVLNCSLFNPNDSSCPNLGEFFRFDKRRFSEGYYGLGAHINVPPSWSSR